MSGRKNSPGLNPEAWTPMNSPDCMNPLTAKSVANSVAMGTMRMVQ